MKIKVLFVIPKNKSMFSGGGGITGFPHVGVAYLSSVLKKNGYGVKIFDDGIGNKTNDLYKLIDNYQPQLFAVTGFSYGYEHLEEIIKLLNNYRCDIPLIVGGPHVAATGKDILEKTSADFAMIGEGEIAFIEFLKQFGKNSKDYSKVPNFIWRKNNKIIQNEKQPLIVDLDKIPFPDYEGFELEKYPCFQEKLLPIITSRGCPYGCNYCSVRLTMGQSFRFRSPENVISELKYWYRKGFKSFDVNDDCFTLNIERAEKICDLIVENGLKIRLQFYNGIRVDRVTPGLLKKLKKAGCTFISYGCESGNQQILNKINKGITLDQVRNAVDWTNKAQIKNSVNFIVGHTGETYAQALDSLRFAGSLPTNFVNFYNLVPYPGTQCYQWAVKNAKFLLPKKSFLREVGYRDNKPVFETKEFTKQQREEIVKRGLDLYKRKILSFRFGKTFGTIIYEITRIEIFNKIGQKTIYENKLGMKIYQYLTSYSKK